jgi:predicted CXXCH cytochrome family protein
VQDIVANFRPAEPGDPTPSGFLLTSGKFVESSGGSLTMPGKCNNCHNTGGNPNGKGGNINYPNPNINGSWALDGVQCEQCHLPGAAMVNPVTGSSTVAPYALALCRDCHSSGQPDYEIPVNVAVNPTTQVASVPTFSNHHPQGDEFRRSPHKNEPQGCTLCHDPHKSVWLDQGGVLYANGSDTGSMCTQCHSERIQADVFAGGMAAAGIECTQCHMPQISAGGSRTAHLFRINGKPVPSISNIEPAFDPTKKQTYYWLNEDGTTAPDGDSFLTLDMVCTQCHQNMSVQNMADVAPFIHRANGMTYLQVNWQTGPVKIHHTQKAIVAFSILAGKHKGVAANCFVLSYGPKGWSSWTGKKWVAGQHPWKSHVSLSDVPNTIAFDSKLPPGSYTFYVRVHTAAQDYNSFVPLKVTR